MITGQSGSGKSTSMNLLLGYYKPQSGEILINDSNAFGVKQLNEKIAIMRQDTVLFNDTRVTTSQCIVTCAMMR